MGAIKLKLACPKNIDGLTVDPEPNWSLDALISELNSLELKLSASSMPPIFTKTHLRDFPNSKGIVCRSPKAFVMRVSDDEMEDMGSDDDKNHDWSLVGGRRFSCTELYLSDTDSCEDELALQETQAHSMDQVGLLEGILSEQEHEHEQLVKEEIRNKVSALEMDLMKEYEKSISALIQVDKYTEVRREMDRKIDTQYRRKIAEALDNHLIAVQRDHEHKSQIEERRIRNDAAFEEAKRKEKALREEKLRQEKAKAKAKAEAEAEAEAEAAKKRAEEAHRAILQAERTAKEAAEKKATETTKVISGEVAQKLVTGSTMDANAEAKKEVKDKGNRVKAAESALKIEVERLQKYKELDAKNQALGLGSNKDFRSYELQIARRIKQIGGTRENVRARASELIKLINDPLCPQSIGIAMFAKKVVSQCEALSANLTSAFACGHVIVLVTSQVPLAMDLLLAEFHKACIYTVPKHVVYSKSASTEEMMGYREDGKTESTDRYLEGVESYMKLYGAIVQTEVDGVRNLHGLKEGWAWLARLLNALPANIYTAVALEAFLKMAGFALFRKYKSQFRKILNVISHEFVTALETRKDPKLNPVITKIKSYINANMFLKEPEGWRLQTSLLSEMGVPEMDSGFYQDQYHHQSNRWSYHY